MGGRDDGVLIFPVQKVRAPRGFDTVYYEAVSSSTQHACSTAFIYMEESEVIEAETHKDLLQHGGYTKAQGFVRPWAIR